MLAEFECRLLREHDRAGLRRRVSDAEVHRNERVEGGDVDDRAGLALGEELAGGETRAVEGAVEVQPDREVPVLEGDVGDRPGARSTGDVEERVERAEAFDGLGDQRGEVSLVGHVGAPTPHAIAEGLGGTRDELGIDVRDDDRGALGDQPFGDLRPDAGHAPGDDRDLAGEPALD